MALFLKQPDQRSELQTRVAEELREKLNARQDVESGEVEPVMTQDATPTKGIGFVLILLALLAIVGIALWLAFNVS